MPEQCLASDAGVEVAGGGGGGAGPGHGGGHLPQLQAAEERRGEGQQGTFLTLALRRQPQQGSQEEEEEKVSFLELSTNLREVSQCSVKAPNRVLLKVLSWYCEALQRFVGSCAPNT